MPNTLKKFTKEWLRLVVGQAEEMKSDDPAQILDLLLQDLKDYIANQDAIDAKRGGKGKTSPQRVRASRLNGAKGGWVKGRPRKKTEEK